MTAAVLLFGGLTLAGCSEAAHSSAGPAVAPNGAAAGGKAFSAAPGTAGAADAANGASGGSGSKSTTVRPPVATGRSVIYSGEIQLRVSHDVDAAVVQAEQLVAAAGGYIDSEVTGTGGVLPSPQYSSGTGGSAAPAAQPLPAPVDVGGDSAQLVLRVPVGSYDAVYRQLMGLGTVLAHDRAAQDVTQQVVDISSRVKTQQASVARVRALMDKAQSIVDVTTLETDLTQREADLESLESQLQALQSQTAMSTVTVQLFTRANPVPVAQPAPQNGVWSAAYSGLKSGWHALYLVFRALMVVLASILPFLVPLGVVLWLTHLYVWRRPRRPGADPKD